MRDSTRSPSYPAAVMDSTNAAPPALAALRAQLPGYLVVMMRAMSLPLIFAGA